MGECCKTNHEDLSKNRIKVRNMAEPLLYFIKVGIRESPKLIYYEVAKRNKSSISRIPFRPMTLGFNITDNCNSRCITCTQWRHKSTNELSTQEVENILFQAKKLGIRSVGFAGGEPLLRKDLPQIVQKTHDLGFENIHITTNGLLLTEEKAISLIERGLSRISISIDGLQEIHDFVRGFEGGFHRSIGAVKTLTDLRDARYPDLEISIGTTLMKPTLPEILNIVALSKQLDVTCGFNLIDMSTYFFKDIDMSGLWLEEEDWDILNKLIDELHKIKLENPGLIGTSHSSLEYMRKYFKDPKRKDIPCYLGYSKIYIGSHGEVYSGCWSLPPMGNLREESLDEIVYSVEYKRRLENMFLKNCPGCSCNYPTNLCYHIPSLFNELKWQARGRMIWKH